MNTYKLISVAIASIFPLVGAYASSSDDGVDVESLTKSAMPHKSVVTPVQPATSSSAAKQTQTTATMGGANSAINAAASIKAGTSSSAAEGKVDKSVVSVKTEHPQPVKIGTLETKTLPADAPKPGQKTIAAPLAVTPHSSAVAADSSMAKPEDKKLDSTGQTGHLSVDPYLGLNAKESIKQEELRSLTLDELILTKKASIAHIEVEMSNIGKKPALVSSDSNAAKFDQQIKKNAAPKLAKQIVAPVVAIPLQDVSHSQSPVTYEPKAVSMMTRDGVHYITVSRGEESVTVQNGGSAFGKKVFVTGDTVSIGGKTFNMSIAENKMTNPDKQSVTNGKTGGNANVNSALNGMNGGGVTPMADNGIGGAINVPAPTVF